MDSLANYVKSFSNYSVYNTNNMYNFHLTTMMKLNLDDRKSFIDNMRVCIGCTYTKGFQLYIFTKMKDSDLLKAF